MEGMSKSDYIVYLRDELGLSFNKIAEIVERRRDSKAVLKVYGLYCKKKRNSERIAVGIVDSSGIVGSIDYYVKSKISEDHEPMFIGDLRERRLELASRLKNAKSDEERRRIYRELNKVKLLELLILSYDLIGISEHDRERMYLLYLYNVGRRLVDKVDLDKDGVKWLSSRIEYLSDDASAFLYVCWFLTLHTTPLYHYLDRVRSIIYSMVRGRKMEKKREEIRRILQEKYADVLADVILRI